MLKNNRKRCYYCKNEIFKAIKDKYKNHIIVDGTNYSDTFEYRPGIDALKEHNVKSPFKELKISKKDIIKYLEKNNLSNLISYPNSCLATRISYDFTITRDMLEVVENGEKFLIENGIKFCRLRLLGEKNFQIETLPEYLPLVNETLLKELKQLILVQGSKFIVQSYKDNKLMVSL